MLGNCILAITVLVKNYGYDEQKNKKNRGRNATTIFKTGLNHYQTASKTYQRLVCNKLIACHMLEKKGMKAQLLLYCGFFHQERK